MMSLLELTRVPVGQATWTRITYATKDEKFAPNLALLMHGGFTFSLILFFRLRGEHSCSHFLMAIGRWKMSCRAGDSSQTDSISVCIQSYGNDAIR